MGEKGCLYSPLVRGFLTRRNPAPQREEGNRRVSEKNPCKKKEEKRTKKKRGGEEKRERRGWPQALSYRNERKRKGNPDLRVGGGKEKKLRAGNVRYRHSRQAARRRGVSGETQIALGKEKRRG